MSVRLPVGFFRREVLTVAPEMLGKVLVRKFCDGITNKFVITEVEARGGLPAMSPNPSCPATASYRS